MDPGVAVIHEHCRVVIKHIDMLESVRCRIQDCDYVFFFSDIRLDEDCAATALADLLDHRFAVLFILVHGNDGGSLLSETNRYSSSQTHCRPGYDCGFS